MLKFDACVAAEHIIRIAKILEPLIEDNGVFVAASSPHGGELVIRNSDSELVGPDDESEDYVIGSIFIDEASASWCVRLRNLYPDASPKAEKES